MEIAPSPLTRSQWDAALGPAAMQHGWSYGAVAARLGATVRRFELAGGGFAQVICRKAGPLGIGYLPLGIHWTGPERPEALAELRRAAGGMGLLIAPGPRPAGIAPRLAGPRQMAVLDIAADPDRQRALQSKKWRNRLGHAERADSSVAVAPGIPDWLVARERAQQRARRYGNLPPRWIAAWARVAPGASLTVVARHGEMPVAAMAFVIHGAAATYLLGWSDGAGRAASAHNLILWRATEELRARGIRRLDLGQVDLRRNAGLAHFKSGAGARLVEVAPCWALGPWSRAAARTAADCRA